MSQQILDKKREEVKIGVISDSHDNMEAIKKAVEIFNERDVDIVMHAGDIVSPFTADWFSKLNSKMILIYGNNDGELLYLKEKFKGVGEIYRDPFIAHMYGKSIVMTHKPEIVDAMAEMHDIVIYGHTHEMDIRRDKALIVNPGESCGYLTGIRSIAIVYPNSMNAEIIEF
jgi:putative phosphoesterase